MEARDKKVVDFINTFGLCRREHIKELYFSEVHQNICMRRLKKLSDDEHIKRIKLEGNIFVYYANKKPSKRLLRHDMHITDLVVKMIKQGYEIIDFKRSLCIGNVISDAYIKYKDTEGKIRHCVIEIQLNNRIEDCILKYKRFKDIILDSKVDWNSIPRIICITDMQQRVELKGLKVLYDNTKMNNLDEILRG